MITFKNISMHYGSKLLFDEVTLMLTKSRRYAIVGANGCGKSTLLRMIMAEEEASLGEIEIAKNTVVGWVSQDHFKYENDRVIDVVIQGKTELWAALQEKEALFNEEWTERSSTRLNQLEETIAHYDGYTAEGTAHTLLEGLGILNQDHEKPLSLLSGGYKMRALLAQALFRAPDILLLDEPTNHLDIMTIGWLEKYLTSQYKGLLLFVSHDIQFLNNVATSILDIDYGEIREYPGNYDGFLLKKQEIAQQKMTEIKSLEEKIAHMQRFVDRFKAQPSKAKQAMSRARMIEKIELPDVKKSSRISPEFEFICQRPSGKQVLTISNITKSFGDKKVLHGVSLKIHRKEKLAIIGHNGIGKSTLLKIIMDKLDADSGTVEWGHETKIAYFAQNHHELLHENMSVMDWLSRERSQDSSAKIRNMLGRMLFTKDDVDKNILSLSGGEGARLLLASIMLSQPNVLVMDEPTNHLDVESIESLAKALKAYDGTLILVSHDRHFVAKMANRIVAMTEAGIKDYHGTYREYLKHYKEDYLSLAFLAGKKK